MGIAQRDTFRPAIRSITQKLRGRLPQSREVWLVSMGWHISALFLFLTLWLSQDFAELSFLALFISIYVHVVVNRHLAERKLKAHNKSETIRRKQDLEAVRQDLTTHLDTTTQAVRQDLTAHLDTTTRKIAEENHTISSATAYLNLRIKPSTPIWFSRDWAATPDVLVTLFDLIVDRKPQFVLDLGSGLTTLIAAHALKINGSGEVIAWEHLSQYASRTRKLLKSHGLERFGRVIAKNLARFSIEGQEFQWFDEPWEINQNIDLLIVDSPPGATGTKARYPAVPLLMEHLAPDATIILDDTNRIDESQIADDWAAFLKFARIETRNQGLKSAYTVFYLQTQSPEFTSPLSVQSSKTTIQPSTIEGETR